MLRDLEAVEEPEQAKTQDTLNRQNTPTLADELETHLQNRKDKKAKTQKYPSDPLLDGLFTVRL